MQSGANLESNDTSGIKLGRFKYGLNINNF